MIHSAETMFECQCLSGLVMNSRMCLWWRAAAGSHCSCEQRERVAKL